MQAGTATSVSLGSSENWLGRKVVNLVVPALKAVRGRMSAVIALLVAFPPCRILLLVSSALPKSSVTPRSSHSATLAQMENIKRLTANHTAIRSCLVVLVRMTLRLANESQWTAAWHVVWDGIALWKICTSVIVVQQGGTCLSPDLLIVLNARIISTALLMPVIASVSKATSLSRLMVRVAYAPWVQCAIAQA